MNTNQSSTTVVTPTPGVVGQGTTHITPSNVIINETAGPKHSSLRGNMDSLVGRFTKNMEKELQGNTIVAASKEERATRYDAKALNYEKSGNTAKAQKNRSKAILLRDKARLKLTQLPHSSPDKYELKAQEWERKGNAAKAQKNRDKAQRLRAKQVNQHTGNSSTLSQTSYANAPQGTTYTTVPLTSTTTTTYTTPTAPLGTTGSTATAPLGTTTMGTANNNFGNNLGTTATTNNLGSNNLGTNTASSGIGMNKPNYPPPPPPTTSRPTL